MPTTCLICCEEAEIFLLPPCNHKEMCWKCCVNLIKGSTFSCPYCKEVSENKVSILFVDEHEMKKYSFKQVLLRNPYKSAFKSYQLYSNEKVARFIEESTSTFCKLCGEVFGDIHTLKKHMNDTHSKQFCDICLENKKCLISEQYIYSDSELNLHNKKGEFSKDGELILYHPNCEFCKVRFYDSDAFRAHLRSSSHLKCHICEHNFPKLKYVYYKDFYELEKHFEKSHYLCKLGDCSDKQLDNVFISEELLEDHQHQAHKKGIRSNKLGMNLNFQDEELEWDQIGKNFINEFEYSEKNYTLKIEDHQDSIIDIREFYPEQVNSSNSMSLEKIKKKLQEILFRSDFRTDMINIALVPLFKPLKMTTLAKWEIEKFIREIYEPRESEPMIEICFNQKYDQRFQFDYLSEVRRKMWSFSPISYYYVFPQLIRFSKYSAETKELMDRFYTDSLRDFKDNKFFVFHVKERASEIFSLLQNQIQNRIQEMIASKKIDLSLYEKYLNDLNPTFYQENCSKIFIVQKEKVKNMYHMVEKTKTNELLKLNWLLKLGFSKSSYLNMYDYFYYKTVENCGNAVKMLSVQELALLYAYTSICMEAILDKSLFNVNKSNCQTMFLSAILGKTERSFSSKDLENLRLFEDKSVELFAKLNPSAILNDSKYEETNEDMNPLSVETSVRESRSANTSSSQNTIIKVNRKKRSEDSFEDEEFPMLEEEVKRSENYFQKKKFVEKKKFEENEPKKYVEKVKMTDCNEKSIEKKPEDFPKLKSRKSREEKDKKQFENQIEIEEVIKNQKKKRKKIEEILEKIPSNDSSQIEEKSEQFEENVFKKKTKEEMCADEEKDNAKKEYFKNKKVEYAEREEIEKEIENSNGNQKGKDQPRQVEAYNERNKIKEEWAREKPKQNWKTEAQEDKCCSKKEEFGSLLDSQIKGHSIINILIKDNKQEETGRAEIKVKKGRKGKAVLIEKLNLFQL